MITTVLAHVPAWVWVLLAALIALGVSQTFPRSIALRRATIMPIALIVLSISGVTGTFHGEPLALAGWAVGLAGAVAVALSAGAWKGIGWSAQTQRLLVPGSWWPLAIIMGIFMTKFAVGTTLAIHPSSAADPTFATLVSLAYGAFSGVFFSRGLAMWKVAHRALNAQMSANAA